LVVGELPFNTDTQRDVSGSGLGAFTPPSSVLANSPAWLDGFMQRALATDVSERFQSISAMSSAMGIPMNGKVFGPSLKPDRSRLEDSITSASYELAINSARKNPTPLPLLRRGFGCFKETLNRFGDIGWKRHLVLGVILASVMIETFIFGGANTLFTPDSKPLPASRIELAEIPVTPPDPTPAVTNEQATVELSRPAAMEPELAPKPAKRRNRASRRIEKPSEKQNSPADGLFLEALDSKRTVTYRSQPENSPPVLKESPPVLQESKISEPTPPRRNTENNTVKPQLLQPKLDVKWEN
jgi:hypothetical protein